MISRLVKILFTQRMPKRSPSQSQYIQIPKVHKTSFSIKITDSSHLPFGILFQIYRNEVNKLMKLQYATAIWPIGWKDDIWLKSRYC